MIEEIRGWVSGFSVYTLCGNNAPSVRERGYMKKLCKKLTLVLSVLLFCSSCSAMHIASNRQTQIMTGTWRIRESENSVREIVFLGSDPLKKAQRSRYTDDSGKTAEPDPVQRNEKKS